MANAHPCACIYNNEFESKRIKYRSKAVIAGNKNESARRQPKSWPKFPPGARCM
mgnify:CR=1 FL=1